MDRETLGGRRLRHAEAGSGQIAMIAIDRNSKRKHESPWNKIRTLFFCVGKHLGVLKFINVIACA